MSTRLRAIRTVFQAMASSAIGLAVVVWQVDGVKEVIFEYLSRELVTFFGTTGISAFIVGWLMNRKT